MEQLLNKGSKTINYGGMKWHNTEDFLTAESQEKIRGNMQILILHACCLLLQWDRVIFRDLAMNLKWSKANTGMSVKVGTGAAWVGEPAGWWYVNDEEFDLTFAEQATGLNRIDRILLRLDRSSGNLETSIQVLTGTPDISPTPVTITQTDMLYEMPIAQVYVTGGSTDIEITDERMPNIYSQSTTEEKTEDWTISLRDMHKFIRANNTTGIEVTVPLETAVPFPLNTEIVVTQHGDGAVTINPMVGVTVYSLDNNLKSNGKYSGFTLRKIATNEWYAIGNLTT